MGYEVTALLSIRENSEEGMLVSVAETETIGVVPFPNGTDPNEFVIKVFEKMREQADTALAAIRVKAMGQLDRHIEALADGTHPLQR